MNNLAKKMKKCLEKINGIQDIYHNNSNNLEETFVKVPEKSSIFYCRIYIYLATIRFELMFCHCDGQKIEEIVSLLMRYKN